VDAHGVARKHTSFLYRTSALRAPRRQTLSPYYSLGASPSQEYGGFLGLLGTLFLEWAWKLFYTAFMLPAKCNGGFTLPKVCWGLELGFSRQAHIHSRGPGKFHEISLSEHVSDHACIRLTRIRFRDSHCPWLSHFVPGTHTWYSDIFEKKWMGQKIFYS
jgi:hypothetical protein